MLANEYQEKALTVEKAPDEESCSRLESVSPQAISLLADMISLGNMADKIKRNVYYKDDESIVPTDFCSVPVSGEMTKRAKEIPRQFHAILGLVSEIGEVCEAYLPHLLEGREVDRVNVGEECGDIPWYLSLLCDAEGLELADTLTANLKKLLGDRFKGGYSDKKAVNRDTKAERESLEEELGSDNK